MMWRVCLSFGLYLRKISILYMHFILEGPGVPVVTEVGLPGKGGGKGGWKISKFQRVTRFM